jgi:hypothetical protein
MYMTIAGIADFYIFKFTLFDAPQQIVQQRNRKSKIFYVIISGLLLRIPGPISRDIIVTQLPRIKEITTSRHLKISNHCHSFALNTLFLTHVACL